jgi:hypothetical protein
MTLNPTPRPTALDELVRRAPAIDTEALAQARQAAQFLRSLQLLSTQPATVIRPFTRRRPKPSYPTAANTWKTVRDVCLAKLR